MLRVEKDVIALSDRKSDQTDQTAIQRWHQRLKQIPRKYSWAVASSLSLVLVGTGFAFRNVDNSDISTRLAPASASSTTTTFTAQFSKRTLKRIAEVPNQVRGVAIASPTTKPEPEKSTQDSTKTSTSSTPAPASASGNTANKTASAPVPAPVQLTGMTIDDVLEMRIALAKEVGSLTTGTSTAGVVVSMDGQALAELSPETGYGIQATNSGMSLDGMALPTAVWIEPAEASGFVAVGDRWYRGRLLLVRQGTGIYAVNYVLLREYLYGVVGKEVSPSWPMEALKAQAVAARSYALTHNIRSASDLYDMDDTPRFQAYGGLAAEYNTTRDAVDATSGEFISYDGGIVESLYAASDQIVQSAHGGLGMSQLGALDFASQGYTYGQILAHYYPETAVSRLDIDQH